MPDFSLRLPPCKGGTLAAELTARQFTLKFRHKEPERKESSFRARNSPTGFGSSTDKNDGEMENLSENSPSFAKATQGSHSSEQGNRPNASAFHLVL